MRSPVEERGRSCRKTSRSRHDGSTFSIPITVISTGGSVVHMRPLPSDSTTPTVPVSAMPKFAPETPTRARRKAWRRWRRAASVSSSGSSPSPSSPSSRANRSRISDRLRWIAGTRMCDDQSCESCTMSSARSVSIAVTPRCSSAWLRSISSVVSDLTLTTSRASWAATRSPTTALASVASRAQCTWPPAACTAASSSSSRTSSRRMAPRLIASPAARSSSQSGTSATTALRLARMPRVA